MVHLLLNSFRYAARQDWDKIAKVLKPVYTAATEEAALERFADTWGKKYPAIVRLRENASEEFTPFLRLDTEIRRIVCTTNTIESVDARIRRAVKARGHFPNEQAGLRCVYMAIMSLDPTGKGQARWTMHWKTALNASTSPSTAVFPQPASNPNHPGYTVRFTDPRAGAGVQDPLGFCAEVRVADEDPGPVLPGLECVLVQPAAHRGCGDGVGDPARSARRPAQGTTSATAVRRSRRGVGKPASSPRRPVRGRNGRLATLSTPVGRPDVPTKRASGTDESRGQRSNVP